MREGSLTHGLRHIGVNLRDRHHLEPAEPGDILWPTATSRGIESAGDVGERGECGGVTGARRNLCTAATSFGTVVRRDNAASKRIL
jgi:hypothetical protein